MTRLLIVIAILAVLAIVVVAMQRNGPRITRIDRRVERNREDRD
jgi:Tfp pilus assembly protein FimT